MTVLVGVRCTDGVVVGADGSATSSAGLQPLVSIQADKIQIIENRIICASTGAVGLGQRVCAILKKAHDEKLFQNDCIECSKQITAWALQDFQSTFVQKNPQNPQLGLSFGSLVAAPFGTQHELVEFGPNDFQPEIKQDRLFYVSMGSGQTLADPFLAFVSRVLWKNEAPEVEKAMFGVLWTLSHTITYAPGGVGDPISLAILKRDGQQWKARLLDKAVRWSRKIGQGAKVYSTV